MTKTAYSTMPKTTKLAMGKSEQIYANIAVPKILPDLGYVNFNATTDAEKKFLEVMDSKMAVDHVWTKPGEDDLFLVQTRFRGNDCRKYGNDFTIRFDNMHAKDYTGGNVKCEYNHIFADFMLYGIANDTLDNIHKIDGLDAYVFVDLREFRNLCKTGNIIIEEGLKDSSGRFARTSLIKDGKIYTPVISNVGAKDTRFITIDVAQAQSIFPKLIIKQEGF